MPDKVPIIFIHCGYSSYMEYSLRQAVATSPGSEVILLDSNCKLAIDGVNLAEQAAYESNELEKFRKNYIHMSYQPLEFEKFCFERWFLLAEFMRRSNIKKAFVMDTDVMIFADMNSVAAKIPDEVVCALSCTELEVDRNYGIKAGSGHSSYWTLNGILRLADFLRQLYSETEMLNLLKHKWSIYSQSHIYGGVTDMDGLWLFKDRCLKAGEFMNTNIMPGCGGVFDNALGSPEGITGNQYVMNGMIKKLEWHDNMPYCRELVSGDTKLFYTLHCQGQFKFLMPEFYSGPDFPGKSGLDREFFFNKYKFFTKRFIINIIKKIIMRIAPKLLSVRRKKQRTSLEASNE